METAKRTQIISAGFQPYPVLSDFMVMDRHVVVIRPGRLVEFTTRLVAPPITSTLLTTNFDCLNP